MPNVQKLKANERLEAIDQEMNSITEQQETRLQSLEGLDPKAEGSADTRKTLLAQIQDGNGKIRKLRDERSGLEAEVEAAELVESESRERKKRSGPKNPKLTEEEKVSQRFSWHRFIDCAANKEKFDGVEGEAIEEGYKEAKELSRAVEGHPLPQALVRVMGIDEDGKRTNLNISKRVQSAGVTTEGGYMIETTLGNLIPALTPRTRVLGMGVQFFPGLEGKLAWPRETNVIQGASVAEKIAAAESSIIFDQVTMEPKRIAHFTEFTRKLMHQGKQAIDVLVPNRLNRGLGIEWDRQLIEGSGLSEELLGILNISGINVVAIGTDGGDLTYNHLLLLEEAIAMDNADVGEIRILTNPKVRRVMKATEKFATTGEQIWEDDNEANSYPVEVTTQVPYDLTKGSGTALSALIQGYWPGLMVGHWGTDIIVNPFSKDKEAMIRVSAHLWTDSDVEHPEMFGAIKDIDTTP
jgi:HK97 family phage major capsid protein